VTNAEERQKILACLNDEEPTSEALLYERLQRGPNAITNRETQRRVINDAHTDNAIRWVAFQGWMKGGRP